MKALSLRPEWAMPVLLDSKTIECRTWKTAYRGDLLICASSRKRTGFIDSHALCVVELTKIEPFTRKHLAKACMPYREMPDDAYAWHFSNRRLIEPFAVKGKLHLFDIDDSLIKIIPNGISEQETLKRYYEPLLYLGKDKEQALSLWRYSTGL